MDLFHFTPCLHETISIVGNNLYMTWLAANHRNVIEQRTDDAQILRSRDQVVPAMDYALRYALKRWDTG